MAITRSFLQSEILTSIFGNRLGIDKNGQLVGHTGMREPTGDATSDTTGTEIPGYGWTTFDTSTDDTWTLGSPVKGAFKYLYTGTTSTGIRTIKRGNANFAIQSSGASTNTTIVAQGGGLLLTLFGVSSALYAVVGRPTGFSSACSTEMALNGTT